MNSDQDTPPQSASSISQPGALHPNRLPPRPEKGAKERTARSAQEVLEEYKECSFDEKMYGLRFCQEKIDCCRAMIKQCECYLDYAEYPQGELARFNKYTTRLAGMEKLEVPWEGAKKSREAAKRALDVLSDMEDLKDLSLQDMVFIHDLYESLEGGFHVSGDTHWRCCKFF